VAHNPLQTSTSLSPRRHSYWYLCVVCVFRENVLLHLPPILPYKVLHYLTRTKKKVYAPHKRKVCSVCLVECMLGVLGF
jgi:hypothetical protein